MYGACGMSLRLQLERHCVCVCTEKLLIIGFLKRSGHDLCSVDKRVKLYVLKHHHTTKTRGGCEA